MANIFWSDPIWYWFATSIVRLFLFVDCPPFVCTLLILCLLLVCVWLLFVCHSSIVDSKLVCHLSIDQVCYWFAMLLPVCIEVCALYWDISCVPMVAISPISQDTHYWYQSIYESLTESLNESLNESLTRSQTLNEKHLRYCHISSEHCSKLSARTHIQPGYISKNV